MVVASGHVPPALLKIPRLDQVGQFVVHVLEVLGDDVDHAVAALQPAADEPGVAVPGDLVEPLPDVLVQDQVGGAGFVLQRHERDALAGAGPLPQDDHARHADLAVMGQFGQPRGRRRAQPLQVLAIKRHRMRPQR